MKFVKISSPIWVILSLMSMSMGAYAHNGHDHGTPTPTPTATLPPDTDQDQDHDHDHGTEPATGHDHEEAIELKLMALPLVYADGVKTRQIINLTPALDNASSSQINLELDQFSNGFRVIDYYDFSIGAGASLSFSLANAGILGSLFGATVGIMPMGGRNMRMERFAADTQALEATSRWTRFPSKATDLLAFSTGDVIELGQSGGVVASAGPSFAGISATASVLYSGIWKTTVEKVSDFSVRVKLDKIHLKNISAALSAGGLVNLSAYSFASIDDGFSFVIDLTKQGNDDVYADFLRGHLMPAQSLSQKADSGVTFVSKDYSFAYGRKRMAQVGIPVLINKKWEKGFVQSKMETLDSDHNNTSIEYASYMDESDYRRLNKEDKKSKTFTGFVINTNQKETNRFGMLSWSFTSTDVYLKRFNRELSRFYKFSGMRKLFDLSLPAGEDLGNLAMRFNLIFPKEATREIMALGGRLDSLKLAIMNTHEDYFKSEDSEAYCKRYHLLHTACMQNLKEQALNDLKSVKAAIQGMNRNQHNQAAFTRSYAELGKAMTRNAFVLQGVLKSLCTPVTFKFEVEGKRVSRVRKVMHIENSCE